MTLDSLTPGQTAVIRAVGCQGSLRRRFLDMGLIPGARITLVKSAPMGGPLELSIHHYTLAMRADDAKRIEVGAPTDEQSAARPRPPLSPAAQSDAPFARKSVPSAGTPLSFALVGNPNSGKTTLFNRLTGANQHVGNFPGVTVERRDGTVRGHANARVTDLPGVYSLSPYTGEERITRRFVLEDKPDCIINIADATALERSLYLTLQLMALDVPVVLALNMMDEVRENGGSIRVDELSALLGVPVVPISAANGEGVDALIACALHAARRPGPLVRPGWAEPGSPVFRALHDILLLTALHAEKAGIPARFAACKLAEGDPLVLGQFRLSGSEKQALERIAAQMERESGLDRAAALAQTRFAFIERLCRQTVARPRESRARARSVRLDRFLTGRYTALPAFVCIMLAVFALTFNVVGAFLSDQLEALVGVLAARVEDALVSSGFSGALRSLILDGVFSGVGSVLSFLPYIVTLFFFLSLLEDSGYMARVAFVMDQPLRRLGLSGRSIVPLLIGFGCTVPGVLAARTLPAERDRKMTILLAPFMSCSAKLPIYAFFSAVFFPRCAAWVMAGLYLLGVVLGVGHALLLRRLFFSAEPVPFVMELPNYRMPGLRNVCLLLGEKAKDFLQRAFTVIFAVTIAVWALQTFSPRLRVVSDAKDSLLALAAGFLSPLFKPLGLGDWRICTALLTGFMAKESVVSTLVLLFGSASALRAALTPVSAASLLVFALLYTPCVAAVACIRRELGARWAAGVVFYSCAAAWVCALAVRLLGLLLFP